MGREYRKKELPLQPVVKAELSESHFKLRLILSIAFGLLAAGMIVYGILSLLRTDPGWQQIQAKTSEGTTCAGEFSFYYNIGEAGIAASAEYKQLVNVYTDAARHAYRVFDTTMEYPELGNLHTLNHHIGEKVALDPLLYAALAAFGDRTEYLFLAPAYRDAANLFGCMYDSEIYPFDPVQNPEEAAYLSDIAGFLADSEAISLTFYDDYMVCLQVSEAYAAFAAAYGIEDFVDFFYMKNAFIIDYLADTITAAGFTRGTLSSYDGYSRNLDVSAEDYTLPVYQWRNGTLIPACALHYNGPMSIVYLRAYPLNGMDTLHYYTLENGEIRIPFIDPADGLARTSTDTLIGYSRTVSCAAILLDLLPRFIGDTEVLDPMTLNEMDPALHVLYFTDSIIHTTGDVTLTNLYTDGTLTYTEAATER